MSAPQEYGFYSNVNPEVDHPRWSQRKERRIGDFFKRETLMFNGYGEQVASGSTAAWICGNIIDDLALVTNQLLFLLCTIPFCVLVYNGVYRQPDGQPDQGDHPFHR